MIGAAFLGDRLVITGIELRADGVDRLHAALAQQFDHLLMNEFDALPEPLGLGARRRLQGALEVVDDGQQVADRIRGRRFSLLASVAVNTLAVIVELGGCAKQAVLQSVFLALQDVQW